jgi:hypothetical protein
MLLLVSYNGRMKVTDNRVTKRAVLLSRKERREETPIWVGSQKG